MAFLFMLIIFDWLALHPTISPAHIKRRLVGKCLKTHSMQQTIFVSSVLDWNKPANEANAGRPLISKRHKISFLAIVPA